MNVNVIISIIHYFTIASGADSTDDGYSVHVVMRKFAGTSDGTRGEFYGGEAVSGSFAKAVKDAVSSNTLDEIALTWDPVTGSVIAIITTT